MKKVLFVTAVAVFGWLNVNAQEVKFGAKGGLNFAFVTGDNINKLDPISDFHAGILAEISISEKFSFQPELLYSGQGSKINLTYINLPLLGKYYLTKGFSIEAGPQIGYLLSAKNGSTDVKNSYKSIDLGASLGASYTLNNRFIFSARYNLGLSNINDVSGLSDKNRNGVFQLSIGYFLF